MFEAVEGAREIGIDHSMPALGRDGGHRAHELSTAIVHQVVNTTMFLHRILHQFLYLSLINVVQWNLRIKDTLGL